MSLETRLGGSGDGPIDSIINQCYSCAYIQTVTGEWIPPKEYPLFEHKQRMRRINYKYCTPCANRILADYGVDIDE